MVDSRAKGARTESVVRDILRTHTGLGWERVPGSGALDPKHGLKGDLYIPNHNNIYCVEVKGYAEDHINSTLLTSKNPQLVQFWEQAVRQSRQVNKKPLLIFKFNRSKVFVAFEIQPTSLDLKWINFCYTEPVFVALLEDWLRYENPKFI